MNWFCEEFAVVSDGNIRLVVFARPIERSPTFGSIWSESNEPKEMSAYGIEGILQWPFDTFHDGGEGPTLTLVEMYPPARELETWQPSVGEGWYRLKDQHHYLRVSYAMHPIVGDQGMEAEYSFLLYSAMDDSILHCAASGLWLVLTDVDPVDLTEAMMKAISHYPSLAEALVAEV